MGPRAAVAPWAGNASDYAQALASKNRPVRSELHKGNSDAEEDAVKRLKDVGNKRTLITAAELGLIQQYRELKQAGQDVLQVDFPYHYSSILYACYGNQYKILQLVEREYAGSREELVRMHTTRCWMGKNSAMVAAYQGHLETILYLVDCDMRGCFGEVDLFRQRDIMGKTAVDWAASQGHTDTLEVLVIRSLYRLLPPASTDPTVLRTRHKLVQLLAELARACRDYDPGSSRRFFQEVLASIAYTPTHQGSGDVPRSRAVLAESSWGQPGEDDSDEEGEDPLSLLGIPSPGAVATLAATKTGAALGSGPGAKQQGAAGAGGRGGGSNRAGEVPKGGVQDVGSEGDEEGQQDQGANDGTASKARAGGVGRSNSMLVRPSGMAKDVHITQGMLQDVVAAAHAAGMNCMGVIMYISELLRQARYFEDLQQLCIAWEAKLLDTCRNKTEVQAILTPTDADPSEPVSYALATFDKGFLSHKFVQQIFTEKWDTMGVTDYSKSALGLMWGVGCLSIAYSCWVAVLPPVLVLRSFFSPVQDFLQRGKVIVDSRFPWHVPLYRWILAQCTLVAFVVLLSYKVFSDSTGAAATNSEASATSPISTLLAVWCVALLVDEAQELWEEGKEEYLHSGWNVMDCSMATCYLLYYILKIAALHTSEEFNLLLLANDLLAASALMAWFRVVSVFELSSAIGPLIQMMKQMLLLDVTRFALLVVVILLGFSVGMKALFDPVCLERDANDVCIRYTAWAYDWQKDGIIGGITFLQYVAMGTTEVTDFEQKRVTGIMFYIVFAVVTAILLLNLFIAMLADTYTRVSTKAQVEFRYRKARIMASFSRREAICPPFNLLHLACGLAGNTLRRLVWGKGNYAEVNLRKNEPVPLFSWYFPQGDELATVLLLQRRVVDDFLRSTRVSLVKERLQADLPILLHHLVAQRSEAVLQVPGVR